MERELFALNTNTVVIARRNKLLTGSRISEETVDVFSTIPTGSRRLIWIFEIWMSAPNGGLSP